MIEFDGIKCYTLKEAAELTQITTTTLRKYIAEGKIEATKAGGRYLISVESLKRWLKA
jgi:excisionase family DNA binding protein